MKKILITGANSYIGMSFAAYMEQWKDQYQVDTLDMLGDAWKSSSFSGYDSIFHVAGIAHIKETEENRELYYTVNRDLPYAVAQKAKAEGVRQLVFLSSMSVYGLEEGVITGQDIPAPKSNYGKSKLGAEALLQTLSDDTFRIAVLRPPMVYGKGCRGNYQTLRKIALTSPVFPKVNNRRSMIYIEHLAEFVRELIEKKAAGLYFPQDREYMNTAAMAELIARNNNHRLFMTSLGNWLLRLGSKAGIGIVRKAFGTLIYQDFDPVDRYSIEECIRRTES